jgi:hypothetical protein
MSMIKTFNRGQLLRLARAGRLASVEIYHFDDVTGSSCESAELPVRIMTDNRDWKDGYCNCRESDFKSGSGSAWVETGGFVRLHVHSNHGVTFRILAKGEAPPAPASQNDPRRTGR